MGFSPWGMLLAGFAQDQAYFRSLLTTDPPLDLL
jgi:hypothetical protein